MPSSNDLLTGLFIEKRTRSQGVSVTASQALIGKRASHVKCVLRHRAEICVRGSQLQLPLRYHRAIQCLLESGYEILLSINSDVETATLFSEALRL